MFVEFDFSFEMVILFLEMLNFLENFFDFDFILLFGDLVVKSLNLVVNDLDFLLKLIEKVLMKRMFVFKLKLSVKDFIIKFCEGFLIFFYFFLMFNFELIDRTQLIKNFIELVFYQVDLIVCIRLDLVYTGQKDCLVGLHLCRMLIKDLIMFVQSAVEKGKVVHKFVF